MRLPALILAAATWSATAEAEENHVVIGAGGKTCAEFAKAYQQEPEIVEALFLTWAQGFLSGVSVMSPTAMDSDDARSLTVQEQRSFIRNYCNQHPLETFQSATISLLMEIQSRRE